MNNVCVVFAVQNEYVTDVTNQRKYDKWYKCSFCLFDDSLFVALWLEKYSRLKKEPRHKASKHLNRYFIICRIEQTCLLPNVKKHHLNNENA